MTQKIQRSFTSGEIAPALQARADTTKYASGLRLCENFFIRAQGGAYSRPGTRFVGELDDMTKVGRLIPFSFNTEQTYMLVFEHLKMRVVKDGGLVLAGGGPAIFELATPYTEAQLSRLVFTQSADVMTITHPDHDPRNLSRTADDAWSLDVVDYTPDIDAPEWITPVVGSITAITQANPAVVTIAAHPFSDGQTVEIASVVGMVELNNRFFKVANSTANTFELEGEDSTTHTAYVSGGVAVKGALSLVGDGGGDFEKTYRYAVTAVNSDKEESLISLDNFITMKSQSVTFGAKLEWDAVTGASYYRVYKDPSNNSGFYGWIGDAASTNFEDYNLAPITSDAPPQANTPFSASDDKPASVTYYQQRQIFANTNNEPQSVFASEVGTFNSMRFSIPLRASDHIKFAIAARQVNEIRHMVPLGALVLLTSGAEWVVTEGQDGVMTPATVGVRPQSFNGSSWVRPAVVNSTALYVQEKGTRIRDLAYEFSADRYTGNDLSVMSEHLFEGFEILEMAYADEPYGILWCVRDDGRMLGLTYLREHQVWGWHQHVTEGSYESVASVTEGDRDAVYVIVNRTIDGGTKRYIERMEPRVTKPIEDAFFVDSGLTYDGAATTAISGLDHLEGEAVAVLADGNEVKNLTVSSGAITLPRAASKVQVGLPYTPAMETLDIDTTSADSSFKASDVSVSMLWMEVLESRGGFAGPLKDDGTVGEMFEFKPRFQSDGYDTLQPKTFKNEVILSDQWAKGGGVRIEQRSPLPLAILSVIPEIDVGDSAN